MFSIPFIICFFFLTLPPPPRSTLFPYTTLFRSAVTGETMCGDCIELAETSRMLQTRHTCIECRTAVVEVAGTMCKDRKSTRLNSSHVEISYAVFCLKKKKKK